MVYLTEAEIIEFHDTIISSTGGLAGIRDHHGLSLLEQLPSQIVFGQELYPTLFHKAALYLRNISQGHLFVDGNKRTSIAIMAHFLKLNSFTLTTNSDEIEQFALDVAEKKISFDDIIEWIKVRSIKNNY